MTTQAAPHPYQPFWDRIAEKYARKPIANPDAYQRKLRVTKALLHPRDRVLDIGCGTGSLALELSPRVAEVQGLDVSSEMVRIAREKADAASAGNVLFSLTNIDVGTDALGAFDVVTAFNLLHLVEDLPRVLRDIYAVTNPGGSFVSSTPCLRETWVPVRPLLWLMRALGRAPHVLLLSVADVEQGLRDAGFVDIRHEQVTRDKTTAFIVARRPE